MLITIRHGQTNLNKKQIFSGRSNKAKLTKEGHLQAYKIGKELSKYDIDIAIVSPLTRALDTYKEINKSINVDYIINENLIERDFKKYEGKPISLLERSIYWHYDKCLQYDIESIEHLVNRVEMALNEIREKYHDKNVLIVAHSGVCRAIRYILEGKINKQLNDYEMGNLHIDIYKEW